MTALTDAKSILETLIGRTLTADQLNRIGNAFVEQDPYDIGGWDDGGDPPIPRQPTNEEVAQHLLDTLKQYGRSIVAGAAKRSKTTELEGTIDSEVQAAVDAALADINP